ncbi:MAG: DUF3107 family protein [Acidimicrobiia bacterium]|nr:DUF3107 family protein [Acidimicrobiia bacterium]
MRVRIAVADTGREIEIDVEDDDAFIKDAEEAMTSDRPFLWVTDTRNHRIGVPVGKIGYIEIEPGLDRSPVGFS